MPLAKHQALRIITAGSVDDGKSTLIGRLLLDTGAIFSDQLLELERIGERTNSGLNLALVTDGLRAERAQGITIDAGYRYFRARTRKIILADTPGHLEFTRNMVAAASNAEAAVILIDAERGIMPQTFRHLILARLMGVEQFVICINKIDLVGYDEARFTSLVGQLQAFIHAPRTRAGIKLAAAQYCFIPTSALLGDNIAIASRNMPWYSGPTLLDMLEQMPNRAPVNEIDLFAVQSTIKLTEPDQQYYGGRMLSGELRPGMKLRHLPAGDICTVERIAVGLDDVSKLLAPRSATLELDTRQPIVRGDVLVGISTPLATSRNAIATICWLSEAPLSLNTEYVFQQHATTSGVTINQVTEQLETSQNEWLADSSLTINQNDICRAELTLARALPLTAYQEHRGLGSGILIDPLSHETLAAVMIEKVGAAT